MEIIETPEDAESSSSDRALSYTDELDKIGSLEAAKLHGIASRIYIFTNEYFDNPNQSLKYCPCCNLAEPLENQVEVFTFKSDLRKLAHHGIGLFLYMFYTKILILVFLVLSISISAPILFYLITIFWQIDGFCESLVDFNSDHPCTNYLSRDRDFIFGFSIEPVETYVSVMNFLEKEQFNNLLDYSRLNFIVLVCWISIYIFLVLLMNYLVKELDFDNITPSDYTLMVTGLTKKFESVEKLKEDIQIGSIKPHIVNPTFKISKISQLKTEYAKLIKTNQVLTLKGLKEVRLNCCKKVSKKELEKLIEVKRIEIAWIIRQFEDKKKKIETFTGVAFAIFKDTKEYEQFYDNFPKSNLGYIFAYLKFFMYNTFLRCCFKEERERLSKMLSIRVEVAPEPTDILFQNLGLSVINRTFRILLNYFLTFLILAVNLLILYYLETSIDRKNTTGVEKYTVSLLIASVILLMNIVLQQILFFINRFEKNRSITASNLTLSIKMTLFTFFNSAIAPIIVVYITDGLDNTELLNQSLLLIFLGNVFYTPVVYWIDIFHFAKLFQRSRVEKKQKNKEPIHKSQRELNELFENVDIDIAYKFAHLAKTMLMTCFFSSVFPPCVIITTFTLIIHYIIEIKLVGNRYKKPENINLSIATFYMNYFKVGIFLFGLGDYIWIRNSILAKYSSINLIMSITLLVFPIHSLLPQNFGLSNTEFLQKTWDDIFFLMDTDYERINPITHEKGLKTYFDALKKQNLISDEEYFLALKRLDNKTENNMLESYVNHIMNVMGKTSVRRSSLNRRSDPVVNNTADNALSFLNLRKSAFKTRISSDTRLRLNGELQPLPHAKREMQTANRVETPMMVENI